MISPYPLQFNGKLDENRIITKPNIKILKEKLKGKGTFYKATTTIK